MLPQTNLQLYRLLIERSACEADLAQVRAAYDLARKLFATSFRPSHKPFVCHLVGVAGALAAWNQPADVVVAGLLHSVYLFGDFGDGQKGAAASRRRAVRETVGAAAESLVERYTRAAFTTPPAELVVQTGDARFDRECLLIKLADVCDECADAGPHYAPTKDVDFGVDVDRAARDAASQLVGQLAGADAAAHFASVMAQLDHVSPPSVLITSDRSYHVVDRFDSSGRRPIRLRLRRLTQAIGRKRAA